MKILLYLMFAAILVVVCFWAYAQDYKTRTAMKQLKALEYEIAKTKEQIRTYKNEWDYLNNPSRLRELVDNHLGTLRLNAITPEHYVTVQEITNKAGQDE